MTEAFEPIQSENIAITRADAAGLILAYATEVTSYNGRGKDTLYNFRDLLMDDLRNPYQLGDYISQELQAAGVAYNKVAGVGEGINGALFAAAIAGELPSLVMALPKRSIPAQHRIKGASDLRAGDRILVVTDVACKNHTLFESISFIQSLGIPRLQVAAAVAVIDKSAGQTAQGLNGIKIPYYPMFTEPELLAYKT